SLHNRNICPISFKQSSVGVPEHVPANALLDTCPQRGRTDVSLHGAIGPERLFAVHVNRSEDVIPRLVVGALPPPGREYICKPSFKRPSLATRFLFHRLFVLAHNATAQTNFFGFEVTVLPAQGQ